MAIRVKLQEVIAGMISQSDPGSEYLNRLTGEFVRVSDDLVSEIESSNKAPWVTPEMVAEIKAISDGSNDYISLPDKHEINDYQIMVDFADSIEDVPTANKLYSALSGKGAFRYFWDIIDDLGLEESWRKFQNRAYEEIAIEWCKDNGIEYEQ